MLRHVSENIMFNNSEKKQRLATDHTVMEFFPQSSVKNKTKPGDGIELSQVRRENSPPQGSTADNQPPKTGRVLPMPSQHYEPVTAGVSGGPPPRADPLVKAPSKLPSVERNSLADSPRPLPQPKTALAPIADGKTA